MTSKKSEVVWPAGSAVAAVMREKRHSVAAAATTTPETNAPKVTHGLELSQDWTPQELRVHPRTLTFEMGTDAAIPPTAGGPGIPLCQYE